MSGSRCNPESKWRGGEGLEMRIFVAEIVEKFKIRIGTDIA